MAKYLTTDTDLTSVANAIRTKGGTSEQLEFPDGFVDAIGDISSGEVNMLNYATRLGYLFLSRTDLPSTIKASFIKLDSGSTLNGGFLYRAYELGKNTKSIFLDLEFLQTTPFSLRSLLDQAYGVKDVKIRGNLQYCTSYAYFMDYANIDTLDFEFDFTSVTQDVDAKILDSGTNSALEELKFKAGTLNVNCNISRFAGLTANCLNTLIAGLPTVETAKTFTIGSGNMAKLTAEEIAVATAKGWTIA